MRILLSELASRLGLEFRGTDAEISGVNTLEKAGPEDLTFLVNPKYAHMVAETSAACVLTDEAHADKAEAVMISANVYMDLARIIHLFDKPQGCLDGVHELSYVHEDAQLAESVCVYPFAFVGQGATVGEDTKIFAGAYVGENARIGSDCIIYPNAVIMGGVTIGDGVIIQPGAVIGADGYGFAQTAAGHMKIPQIGVVEIADNVEVGANTAIDRAALDKTVIGMGTKIDNLVQIGHNVRVGEHCLIVGQVGIGGSTEIGNGVVLGGQVGVSDNAKVGDNVMVGAQSGLTGTIPDGSKLGGSPSMPYNTFLKSMGVCAPKLPELFKRVKKLEKQLADLEKAQTDK